MSIRKCFNLILLASINLFLLLSNLAQFIECLNLDTKKVVMHQPAFARHTNFGYSVAAYHNQNDSWILVGAPLHQRDRFHSQQFVKSREGGVYRCRTGTPNSCYMLPFDKKEWQEARDYSSSVPNYYFTENKTDQYLGSTLLSAGDIILACAPNYRSVTKLTMLYHTNDNDESEKFR